ncbi:MAG: sn-glycerol-3-phosphate ABC transporter ATP-binding protein UgpC [Hyphomicrobiales bacterium]|nr:sn-glycerol-3-phosphate ABC transporter ATP-binding protein UgpC [Hyphomicrobiales bacterium]MDE2017835.1 sn-glycerol-3-phosphate ABC transporter ATP-binding protein UgpC [Hyphomicrobiales bacterium]
MAGVTLRGVKKRYPGGFEAIKGIDLDVPDGDLCVFVGPSGCGKSTLLRIVAGLETASEGTVAIGGRDVGALGPAERDVAMVFQNYALYPHMSVFDNMAYGLRNRGAARPEIEARVAEAAAMLDLSALLARKPRELSGGQRQRVAMGRAIVRKPALFLFDEPLSNLDAKLRARMRVEIRALQRRLGTTAIHVTHDQLEAMTMADTLVVLNAGRVEQVGKPADVYARPANRFVAGFLGSPEMNFLDGEAGPDGRIDFGALGSLSAGAGARAPVSRKVVAGIRPENLAPAEGDGPDRLSLTVDFVEELGAARLVYASREGRRVVVHTAAHGGWAPGAPLALTAAAGDVRLFDPQGGAALG